MIPLSPTYQELEAIYGRTIGRGARSVSVSAIRPGDGATTLAQALAARSSAAGLRTIYLDLNLHRPIIRALDASWRPGDRSVAEVLLPSGEGRGFDLVPAPSAPASGRDTLIDFREGRQLARLLGEELADYEVILIDTSPVSLVNGRNIPADRVAAACDAAILIGLSAVTTQAEAKAALEQLRLAGANVAGFVLNDREFPTLGEEFAREARRLRRFLPGLSNRLSDFFLRSTLLRRR